MVQGSTVGGRLAAGISQLALEASRTEPYHAELSLSFDTKDGRQSFRLSIEAPTLEAGSGILRAAYASICITASRDQSSSG